MNKLRGVTLPKKWLTFDEIKDKATYPTSQNKIEQLEKYIEVREQEIEELNNIIDELEKNIKEHVERCRVNFNETQDIKWLDYRLWR